MGQPNKLEDRVAALEARVTAIATEMQRGSDRLAQAEARFAAGEQRLTEVAQAVTELVTGQAATSDRVTELVAAAQGFASRMAAVEEHVANDLPSADEARITALEGAVGANSTRIEALESTRARGGRLSSRLTTIEQKLDQVIGGQTPPTEGVTK